MSELAAHPGERPQYGREIVILLMALFVCAELAAAVFGLVYPPKWVAAAMLVVIGLVTILFALVQCGAIALFFGRGRTTGDSAPQQAQFVAVGLLMSVGIGAYTFAASFVGFTTGFFAMSDHPPPSAAAAFFSSGIQFWLFLNPASLVCGAAIVMLFARMLSLSHSSSSQTTIPTVV